MLKLSKLTDYAVVTLTSLQDHIDDPVAASVIASETKMPEPTVAKVLKLLAGGGLVKSTRGMRGGYQLSKTLAEITVKDVIVAIEGPIALTACVEDAGEGCDLAPVCEMHGRWNKVNTAIKDALDAVSLADMMAYQVSHLQRRTKS